MNRAKITTLAICLALAASSVHADSKKWRANNHSDETVKVFWYAHGCSGQKPDCDGGNMAGFICKTKILHPGEESDYRFPGGTSSHKKGACAVDYGKSVQWTKTRKRNGIKVNDVGQVDWYDD